MRHGLKRGLGGFGAGASSASTGRGSSLTPWLVVSSSIELPRLPQRSHGDGSDAAHNQHPSEPCKHEQPAQEHGQANHLRAKTHHDSHYHTIIGWGRVSGSGSVCATYTAPATAYAASTWPPARVNRQPSPLFCFAAARTRSVERRVGQESEAHLNESLLL